MGIILPIDDDDALFRRIAPDFVKKDGSVSTNAFKRNRVPDNEISLELEALSSPEECSNRGKDARVCGGAPCGLTPSFPRI